MKKVLLTLTFVSLTGCNTLVGALRDTAVIARAGADGIQQYIDNSASDGGELERYNDKSKSPVWTRRDVQ